MVVMRVVTMLRISQAGHIPFFGCHCRLHTTHVAYFDTNSYLQCLAPNVCNKLLVTHILWKCEYKTQNNKHKHTCNVPC